MSLESGIAEILTGNGAGDAGVCPFSAVAKRLISCAAVKRLPENARSVICAVFPYKVCDTPPENISRYAAVPDYHIVCGEILKKSADELKHRYSNYRFEPFIDNSPVPEVAAAVVAGLGVRGRNGLLIHPVYGSYCFIGEIVTDMPLDATAGEFTECADCGACAAACPVGLDKTQCLSRISQQKKPLDAEQERLLAAQKCVWGCDICSEVCPMNRNALKTGISEFINGYRDRYTQGEDISGRAYEWRGAAVILRNFRLSEPEQ